MADETKDPLRGAVEGAIDRIENLLGALCLPLSDRIHVAGIRPALPEIRDGLRAALSAVSAPRCDDGPQHRASLAAPPLDFPSSWPIDVVLERLADAADHLRGAHDCDAQGHEGVLYATQAAREHVKRLRSAPAPEPQGRLSEEQLADLEHYSAEPGDPDAETCAKCSRAMSIRDGMDPTMICDECAQDIVANTIPSLLAEVRALRASVSGAPTGTRPSDRAIEQYEADLDAIGHALGICYDHDHGCGGHGPAEEMVRAAKESLRARQEADERFEYLADAAHSVLLAMVAGGPKCSTCGSPASCVGAYESLANLELGCDKCCGHGNEDGWCVRLSGSASPTPGVAAGGEGAKTP